MIGHKDFKIRLAGMNITVSCLFQTTKEFCGEYIADGESGFSITVTPKDIDFERNKSKEENQRSGTPVRRFSDEYLETLAVYRKIAERLVDFDTILFHGSVIAVDGEGYLFTAKSGTGKSTHTRLWREQFGSRAVMVNDDKPLLKITDSGVMACGTPWDGKHHLSDNIAVSLKAICILNRDSTNHIESVSAKPVYPLLLQQTYRPSDPMRLAKTLQLLEKLMKMTKLYTLGCNMELEAARVAFNGMNIGKEE